MAPTVDGNASEPGGPVTRRASQSVQSVERAFSILETMADAGGVIGISHLANEIGLPVPTIHRLVRTLVDLGYLQQDPNRRYVLGPRLIRLGEDAAKTLTVFAYPHLVQVADKLGETSNMARLEGNEMVYVAQVPSKHSMRTFTEVGKRVSPHCTAVGKCVLATLPRERVQEILQRSGMPALTDNTITSADQLAENLRLIAHRGYAIDDGEHEFGVRCVAVPLLNAPAPMAISISGPASRITEDLIEPAAETLRAIALRIVSDMI